MSYYDSVELYDSARAGDPATPEQMAMTDTPWCRNPLPTYGDRLDLLNEYCYQRGRHRKATRPFTSCADAVEWLWFRRKYRAYYYRGDVLVVQCPVCQATQGERCISLNYIRGKEQKRQYLRSPHTERELWFIGRERRKLNKLPPPTPEERRAQRKKSKARKRENAWHSSNFSSTSRAPRRC